MLQCLPESPHGKKMKPREEKNVYGDTTCVPWNYFPNLVQEYQNESVNTEKKGMYWFQT